MFEPFSAPFFLKSLLATSLIATLCGVVGVYVVLRGLSYIGDALAHAVFPGIVGAFLLKINLFVGAIIAATIASLGIGFISNRSKLQKDSVIGIVFVGMFALGVALLSKTKTYALDLTNFLVGNVFSVSNSDILSIIIASSIVFILLAYFHRRLTLISFDEIEAKTIGLPIELINQLFLLIISITVVLAIQAVGTTLVVSLLITSSSTARLLTDRLGLMFVISSIVGVLSSFFGLYISWFTEFAPGASIVLINTVIFLLIFIYYQKFPRS